ncbi:MAG: hypothetical protein ACTS47_02225, partial [Candidatus Hodgkinia cicadicola]
LANGCFSFGEIDWLNGLRTCIVLTWPSALSARRISKPFGLGPYHAHFMSERCRRNIFRREHAGREGWCSCFPHFERWNKSLNEGGKLVINVDEVNRFRVIGCYVRSDRHASALNNVNLRFDS